MGGRNLPFKVGDLVEARSFQIGFRGAWFRCKIREITKRQGRHVHLLEYYDFPDEKLKTIRLYQVPYPPLLRTRDKHKELMVRPQYPPIYNEKQMPNASEFSEVAVIVDNSWKVGDLVDWWSDGCYWCGNITQLLGDDKAQVELKPPPLGEGQTYDVFLKDVRPSLDWSLERGWTILCQEGESGRPCPRLMKPINQGVDGACPVPSDSAVSDETKSPRTTEMKNKCSPEETGGNNSTKCRALAQNPYTSESAIMELEEYINKINWLKRVLHYGISSPQPPQWEVVDVNPIP
ncbi:hypothetical protein ACS0TY_009223 [Phlomoides rotata]